jgi:hypothetical protein
MRFDEFVFYNTGILSMDEKATMLRDCMEISYTWWADKLDCSVSVARQQYDCSFEEILGRLKESARVIVVDRGVWGGSFGRDREHFEVGFCSMESPVDYFLFIEVDSEKMPPILKKYNLNAIVQ